MQRSKSSALNNNRQHIMKTVTAIRRLFWESHPQFADAFRTTYRQNRYNATIRSVFVDFVDSLNRGGEITDNLANRATL